MRAGSSNWSYDADYYRYPSHNSKYKCDDYSHHNQYGCHRDGYCYSYSHDSCASHPWCSGTHAIFGHVHVHRLKDHMC
jgi:hypothetical protein